MTGASLALFLLLASLGAGRALARDDAECDLAIEKAWEAGQIGLVLNFAEKCRRHYPLDPNYHSMISIANLQMGDYLKAATTAAAGVVLIKQFNKNSPESRSIGEDLGLLWYLVSASQFRNREQAMLEARRPLPVGEMRKFVASGRVLAGCSGATPTKQFSIKDRAMDKDNADNACNEYLLFDAWDSLFNGDSKRGCAIISSLYQLTGRKLESVPSPFFGFDAQAMSKKCRLDGRLV